MVRFCLFFFNDTATTEIYTLSLHDALPICHGQRAPVALAPRASGPLGGRTAMAVRQHQGRGDRAHPRSEEHTSELQSPCNLVCRLLLEKKKITRTQGFSTVRSNALPTAVER